MAIWLKRFWTILRACIRAPKRKSLILGHVHLERFLKAVGGSVVGRVCTDAKERQYRAQYRYEVAGNNLRIWRENSQGEVGTPVLMPRVLALDEALVAFFGLYSGDGSKGAEDASEAGRIRPNVSFSQRERHLVRFAVDQFRRIFVGGVKFTFSIGEDSAFFLAGVGADRLRDHYLATAGSPVPPRVSFASVRPTPDAQDTRYLAEHRADAQWTNEEYLAFYYQHQEAMKDVLSSEKAADLATVGIIAADDLIVSASVRRPFKKGARLHGGSSRSDELHLGGVAGMGELFLKMLHEVEDSIIRNSKLSSQEMVEWLDQPARVGTQINVIDFFTHDPWGGPAGERPKKLVDAGTEVMGQWARSSETRLTHNLRLDPLWCYVAGLYLAEGTSDKSLLFSMYTQKVSGFALGFTSSEGASLELMLRALRHLFQSDECLSAWKVKVGSQYFPELVMCGTKLGVPMLRGGASGDGKLRTMEISLSIKEWALEVADEPIGSGMSILRRDYADRYSHVEPTGAGVARIDFWASSVLCRWYFPLLMRTVFGGLVADPAKRFY